MYGEIRDKQIYSFWNGITFGSKKFEVSEYLTKYLLLSSRKLDLSCCDNLFRRDSTSGAHHKVAETESHLHPAFRNSTLCPTLAWDTIC
jgi:hypothetical protein